jgi:hypothetical protein
VDCGTGIAQPCFDSQDFQLRPHRDAQLQVQGTCSARKVGLRKYRGTDWTGFLDAQRRNAGRDFATIGSGQDEPHSLRAERRAVVAGHRDCSLCPASDPDLTPCGVQPHRGFILAQDHAGSGGVQRTLVQLQSRVLPGRHNGIDEHPAQRSIRPMGQLPELRRHRSPGGVTQGELGQVVHCTPGQGHTNAQRRRSPIGASVDHH